MPCHPPIIDLGTALDEVIVLLDIAHDDQASAEEIRDVACSSQAMMRGIRNRLYVDMAKILASEARACAATATAGDHGDEATVVSMAADAAADAVVRAAAVRLRQPDPDLTAVVDDAVKCAYQVVEGMYGLCCILAGCPTPLLSANQRQPTTDDAQAAVAEPQPTVGNTDGVQPGATG